MDEGLLASVIGHALPCSRERTAAKGWSMGSNATTWDIILHYWTVTIFVPAILLVIATLAIVTRVVDD
jgi:hypothetical protein